MCAAPIVPWLIWPILRSNRIVEKEFVMVCIMEMRRNKENMKSRTE